MDRDPEAASPGLPAVAAARPEGGRARRQSGSAGQLEQSVERLGRLLRDAAARPGGEVGEADVSPQQIGAALGLFEEMRSQLDQLETQVVIEARRRGMDWKAIASHQGLNSPQAASQRYQRQMTRLEEIRQGVRWTGTGGRRQAP